MSRRFLTVSILVLAMMALSQLSIAQQIINGTVTTSPVSGNTALLGNGPTTPVMTYAAPGPTAGISNAGRAGISNSAPLPSTLTSNDTVVYYSQPGVQPMVVLPATVEGTGSVATAPEAAGAETAPAGTAVEGSASTESVGKISDDFGPSSFGGTSLTAAGTAPNANGASLAQIAAQYKTARAGLNARTLTNQDVDQMLSSKPGVTVAKNMPPLGSSAMPSGLTQGGVPQQSQPQNAPSSPETVPKGAGGQEAASPPPVAAPQAQPPGSTATAGAATNPQINPNQQSNDAQGKSKLPSTATFLPLLGLLGLISGGIGLLARKLRR